MKKPPWVIDLERELGIRWKDADIYDQLRYQNRYVAGRYALHPERHELNPLLVPIKKGKTRDG